MGQRSQTHCAQGHAFTPDNTYLHLKRAWRNRNAYWCRRCRACCLWGNKLYDTYKRDLNKCPKKKRNAKADWGYHPR
jgi:hypothetical protein